MRTVAWLLPIASCFGGCFAVLDFDVSDEEGSGGATASASVSASSTAPSTSSTLSTASSGETSTGAGCAGCVDGDGACRTGDDVDACGATGAACAVCEGAACKEPTCDAGGCALVDAPDDTSCAGGRCRDGTCDQTLENCTDGADDDDDGAADCADDDCDGIVACVPAVPDGWSGPFTVVEDLIDSGVACPAGFTRSGPLLYTDPADVFTCGTCTCDTACTAEVTTHVDQSCVSEIATTDFPQQDCVDTLPDLDARSFSVVTTSTCSASLEGRDTTPTVFGAELVLCAGDEVGAGCAGGETCRPVPSTGRSPRTCIAQDGKHACPASGFTVAEAAWSDRVIDDPRSCTTCTCLPPSPSCGGAVELYEDALCTTCTLGNACDPIAPGCYEVDQIGGNLYGRYVPENTCTPTGTEVVGEVGFGGEQTICCLP